MPKYLVTTTKVVTEQFYVDASHISVVAEVWAEAEKDEYEATRCDEFDHRIVKIEECR